VGVKGERIAEINGTITCYNDIDMLILGDDYMIEAPQCTHFMMLHI
jgi:hypothetical protein